MKKTLHWLGKWLRRLVLFFLGSTLLVVILYRFVPVYFTPLMLIRYAEALKDDKKEARILRDWTPLEDISPNLWLAVVAAEDQNFMTHFGFDLDAIEKAREHNKKSRRIRGASTISQQTAKNVFLWPQRSWLRKGLEAYFTFLIEVFWGKKRILEVYLNVAEMGQGIYGAEAAAQFYYHKSADRLTRSEAALLAAILPSPLRRNPARPSAYLLARQQRILNQMNNLEKISFD
ncbi:MAG: monofunctional biosynthetic peptidoglycan transglycosylase [Bacteroidales bacterium]